MQTGRGVRWTAGRCKASLVIRRRWQGLDCAPKQPALDQERSPIEFLVSAYGPPRFRAENLLLSSSEPAALQLCSMRKDVASSVGC